jgi:Uma2 family endonuclease
MDSATAVEPEVVYPESDGKPMAEGDLQYRAIVTLQGGLDDLFRDVPDVIVKADMFWYPVRGEPGVCIAPDVFVIFGRPKGDRGSYQQWVEGGVAPHVVFEVRSPSNRDAEMAAKLRFYDRHGVDEYYVYDPQGRTFDGYRRDAAGDLVRLADADGYTSPRLGVRFDLADELIVTRPDGLRFLTYLELGDAAAAQARRAAEAAAALRREREATARRDEIIRANLRAAGIDPGTVMPAPTPPGDPA